VTERVDPPDEVLIRRFRNGDEEAFVCLYRRHSPSVFGVLSRLLGNSDGSAGDLLQEAWIRAAAGLGGFRGEAQFRTWLTGIALNCYREWRRHIRHDGSESLDDLEVPATNAEADADVARILSRLPRAFREILVLHDVEGYTHQEIAALLDIEVGTSKSRLSRARETFRRRWAPAGPEGHS
jgi:RNA polymerase sigma factor (sigma-70 family)